MESLGSYGGGLAGAPYRGNGGNLQAAGTATDESPSRIRDAIGMTEQLMEQLHGAIDRVEKRLDTVLTPTPPQPSTADSEKNPTPVSSHLFGRVGNQNLALQHAIERLTRLAQRVEI